MPGKVFSPYHPKPIRTSFLSRCIRTFFRYRQFFFLIFGVIAVYFALYGVLVHTETHEIPKQAKSKKKGVGVEFSKFEGRQDVVLPDEAYRNIKNSKLSDTQNSSGAIKKDENLSEQVFSPLAPRKRNSILRGNVNSKMDSFLEPVKSTKKSIYPEEKSTIDGFLNKEIKFLPDNNFNEENEDETLNERHKTAKKTRGSSISDKNDPFDVSGNEWGKERNDDRASEYAKDYGTKEKESGVGHGSLSKLQLNLTNVTEVIKGKSLNASFVNAEFLSNATMPQNETYSNVTETKAFRNITGDDILNLSNSSIGYSTENHTVSTNKTVTNASDSVW